MEIGCGGEYVELEEWSIRSADDIQASGGYTVALICVVVFFICLLTWLILCY